MRKWVLVLLALAVTPPVASANTLTIDFTGVGKGQNVTLAGAHNGTVFAGEINWRWLDPPPAGSPTTFYTYCVDLLNYLTDPQEVDVRSTNEMPNANTAHQVAWLFNTYAPLVHGSTGTSAMAAGLQVLMWDLLVDGSFDTANGSLRASMSSAAYTAASTFYSGLVTSGTAYLSATATWLDATPKGQDQITTSVPEPATLLLMGLGLAGVGLRRRRLA